MKGQRISLDYLVEFIWQEGKPPKGTKWTTSSCGYVNELSVSFNCQLSLITIIELSHPIRWWSISVQNHHLLSLIAIATTSTLPKWYATPVWKHLWHWTVYEKFISYPHRLILYVDSLSMKWTSILPHINSVYKTSKSGEQVDPLEISTMHERLLCLVAQKAKAKPSNRLGNICSEHHNSREINALHRAVTIYSDAVQQARG